MINIEGRGQRAEGRGQRAEGRGPSARTLGMTTISIMALIIVTLCVMTISLTTFIILRVVMLSAASKPFMLSIIILSVKVPNGIESFPYLSVPWNEAFER